MEELLAYSYLLYSGLVSEDAYEQRLNELFLSEPGNDILLELESVSLTGGTAESVSRIQSLTDFSKLDIKLFGKKLTELLRKAYEAEDIDSFSEKAYLLWEELPRMFSYTIPFFYLRYNDDRKFFSEPVIFPVLPDSRRIYEKMLSYYDAPTDEPLTISYYDILSISKYHIQSKHGEWIIFSDCAGKDEKYSEKCVGERDITADPPYVEFFTPERRMRVVFDKTGAFEKNKNKNNFIKFHSEIQSFGFTTFDLS